MSTIGSFPVTRMRRLRYKDFVRTLVQEQSIQTQDLILPIFIHDSNDNIDVKSMPGVQRHSLESLLMVAERCLQVGVPAVVLFPAINDDLKSLDARQAYNEEGLVPKAIRELKKRFPELGVITDVALDPYTSHGQDGLVDDQGLVMNDETVTILRLQALCHAQAGCDIVSPSDMMDGRIGAIRTHLDKHGFNRTLILSYAAKYASAFYGPFRDAVGSSSKLGKGTKFSYQINPANSEEAIADALLDIKEGADILMVKPGLPYLDIVAKLKQHSQAPVFAYQVSGEYSMLKAAAMNGWVSEKECMIESLLCFKRAGCNAILSYFSLEAAEWIKNNS